MLFLDWSFSQYLTAEDSLPDDTIATGYWELCSSMVIAMKNVHGCGTNQQYICQWKIQADDLVLSDYVFELCFTCICLVSCSFGWYCRQNENVTTWSFSKECSWHNKATHYIRFIYAYWRVVTMISRVLLWVFHDMFSLGLALAPKMHYI